MSSSRYPSLRMPSRRLSARVLRLSVVAMTSVLALGLVLNVTASTSAMNVPGYAAPGAQITVTGTGFSSSQTGNLTFNGAVITSFKASSAGAFTAPFTIPASAPVNTLGRISAKTAAGAVLGTSTLGIARSLTAATLYVPANAAKGSTIKVGGAGFTAGATGNLTYNGAVIAAFAAAANGSFEVPFAIPAGAAPGTGRISAKTASGSLIATITLGVGASTTSGTNPIPTAGPTVTANPTAAPTVTPKPTANPTAAPTAAPPAAKLPNWSHVYVIYFENKEYSSVVGSSSAPFINSLVAKYGLSTGFYAERHPSEPNYIALTSGGLQGTTDDGTYNLNVDNLFMQVERSGRTWASVQQGWPGGCFTGTSSAAVVDGVGKAGAYVRKHNPAISYTSISGNPAECAKITNMASFNPAGASFQFITPNMINDMHDGTVADGDNWLKAFLPKITGSSAFANSVVFVTFDEGTTNVNGGGHIMTIAITPGMTAGFKQSATYTHYSMLRTIEQAWGLPCLGSAGSAATMNFPW